MIAFPFVKHLPNEKHQRRRTMRRELQFIAFAVGLLLTSLAQAQTADSLFPKGDLSTTKNHTGNIWLSELNVGDSTFDPSIAQATYGPGATLDWHIHPGGQVLLNSVK
jgi:hypothetical protein